MLALVKQAPGPGNLKLAGVSEPACPPSGVKIEVRYAGICGTDIHIRHGSFRSYPPVILEYEFSGTVVQTGAGIETRARATGSPCWPPRRSPAAGATTAILATT